MATFTAIGPASPLAGPLPVAPEHSLLKTRILDPDGDLVSVVKDRSADRVLNGVNLWGYPTGCSFTWEPCLDGTFRIKESESEQLSPRFDSFVVYKPITCSPISGQAASEELAGRISRVLEATESAAIENALAFGVDGSDNPFFADGTVDDLTSATAVSPGVGLSMLEDAIAETCRAGMIWATPGTIAALQAFPLPGDDTRLVTANGTPVVSAAGLLGGSSTELPAPAAGEAYMFATGPVEVYLGPIVMTSLRESLEREENVLTFRAERYVLAVWDTALQAAALVDWTT